MGWTDYLKSRRPQRHAPHIWRRRRSGAITLLVLLIGLTGFFMYFANDARILHQTITALEQVTGGQVELQKAKLTVLLQIRIEGLKIFLPERPQTDKNLVFEADDVIIRHEPLSLLLQELRIKKIIAYATQLYVWHNRDTNITNLQLLRFPQDAAQKPQRPIITLRDCTVQYSEIHGNRISGPIRQGIEGRIYPDAADKNLYRFELHNIGQGALGESQLVGSYNFKTSHLDSNANFLLELLDLSNLPQQIAAWQRLYQIGQPSGRIVSTTTYDPATGPTVNLRIADGHISLPLAESTVSLYPVTANITCTKQRVIIEKLNAHNEDYGDINVTGTIEGYNKEAAFDLTIQTENFDTTKQPWPELLEDDGQTDPAGLSKLAELLPEQIQEFVTEFSPAGRMDLALTLKRPSGPDQPITYSGKLTCINASASYSRFPYDLHGLIGEISFEPGKFEFGPLSCQNGGLTATVAGNWRDLDEDKSEYDITVTAQGLSLDEKLYRAIGPAEKKFWQKLAPDGLVDIIYKTARDAGQNCSSTLEIELTDLSVRYQPLPIELSKLKGKAFYKRKTGTVSFEIDSGNAAMAQISMSGTIKGFGSTEEISQNTVDCFVKFEGLALDDALAEKLPERPRKFYKELGLYGRADGTAHFRSAGAEQPDNKGANRPPTTTKISLADDLEYQIDVHFRDGKIFYQRFPYLLESVNAHATLTNEQILIKSLNGRNKNSDINIAGFIKDPDDYQLSINCHPLEVTEELLLAIQSRQLGIMNEITAVGATDLSLELKRRTDEPFAQYSGTVSPRNCNVSIDGLDYTFENVTGEMLIDNDHITIERLGSNTGRCKLSLTGEMVHNDEERSYELDIFGQSLALDERLYRAMPPKLRAACNSLNATGEIDFDLSVTHQGRQSQSGQWQITGPAQWKNGTLAEPMLIEQIDCPLQINTSYDSDAKELAFDADLLPTAMTIEKRPIDELIGKIEYDPASESLVCSDISGNLCGGRLAAPTGRVALSQEQFSYALQLQLNDLDLAELLEAAKAPAEKNKNLKGRFAGWFNTAGEGPIENRRGKFVFVITDAVLGELTIAAQLLGVLNLSLPKQGAFNEASISGDIIGREFLFDNIHLRGSAVSLTGAGLMATPGRELNLVFMVDAPQYIISLPVISSFIDAVRPAIVQVRVSGTFDEPIVEPIAFPSLEDALQELGGRRDKAPSPQPR